MNSIRFQHNGIRLIAKPSAYEKGQVEIIYLDGAMKPFVREPVEREIATVYTRGENMRRTVIRVLSTLKNSRELGWMITREGLGPSQQALAAWHQHLIGLR